MANLILLQTPLTPSYEHVMDFPNKYIQYNFFMSKFPKMVIEDVNTKVDAYQNNVLVQEARENLNPFDYAILDDGGKKFYYFIEGFMVETKSKTNIVLTLDVFQTYLDEWKFGYCFVDRCHVPRWQPDGQPLINNVDEGLEYGTMLLDSVEDIYNYSPKYIICATTPIGKLDTSGGGGDDPTTGDWNNGVPSSDMFRFLKGYEGFGEYQYSDSGGVPTIGYGITQSEPDDFATLVSSQPCSEEQCAKIAWDVLIANYGKKIVNAVKSLGCTEQKQFDALCDLAYNAGVGRVTNPNGTLVLAIQRNPTDESYIRPIWEKYIITDASGTELQGLKDRRKAECDIYFQGNYEKRAIPKLGSSGQIVGTFDGDGWLPN